VTAVEIPVTGKGRGLSGSSRALPAEEIEIRFGHGLLAEESATWPPYLVATSPSAYRAALPHLATPAAAVIYVESLDSKTLRAAIETAACQWKLVVGLGGGMAVDAAKYFAAFSDVPLVQVPTIVSTGAIVHGYCGSYEGRRLVGDRDRWAWADCEHVLLDYELVLQAPPHLNTAGLGDVLCEYSGIAEWRSRNHQTHAGRTELAEIVQLEAFHRSIISAFPRTLDPQGALTEASICLIAESLQARDAHRVSLPCAPNADHAFLLALEQANDRSWIHGEAVALGALIVSWHCDEAPTQLASDLDTCQVRWCPGQLSISKEQLWNGISLLTKQLRDAPDAHEHASLLHRRPLTANRFEQLWSFLNQDADPESRG
jgi:glycerol dehydrogenase-like iron-containing ADH family enzyme